MINDRIEFINGVVDRLLQLTRELVCINWSHFAAAGGEREEPRVPGLSDVGGLQELKVLMSTLEDENRGKGGGLFELFWQGGYAISPPISGRWIQTSGFIPSFYVAAMGYGLSAVIFYGTMRSKDLIQKG